MQFNVHRNLQGLHAPFSASQPHWLRYDDDKLIERYRNKQAAERGTRLHAWAKETIDLGIKQRRSSETICSYINDAIGYRMDTEVVLYYSDRFFGTADAISFSEYKDRNGNRKMLLRIHDLKTGKEPAKIEQLYIYAALFCLEYKVKPFDIDIELRLYQNDEILYDNPSAEDISEIMDRIVYADKLIFEQERLMMEV